jgi:hypothetical protein
VVYAFNLSYLGGRDEEDHDSRPAEWGWLTKPVIISWEWWYVPVIPTTGKI